nr:spermidine/putrescine-binding periplasmic protein 2 precursor [Bradyrhizobium sp. DOA9]
MKALGAAAIAAPLPIRAQSKRFDGITLNVNSYGGDYDRIMTETIARPLAERTGLKVTYTPGSSTAAVAKILAAPGAAPFDIVLCDSPNMPDLIKAQAIDPVDADAVPGMKKLLPKMREFGQFGLPYSIASIVLTYNTSRVKAPLSSFAELAEPSLKNRVAMLNLENTGGMLYFIAMAEAGGGSVDNVEPAFAALSKVKPNIVSVTPATVSLVQVLEQEEAWAAPLWDGRIHAMRKAGRPMALVRPKEGVYSLLSYASPVKGTKHPDAVRAYLDQAVSDEAIAGLAKFFRYGPTTSLDLGPEGQEVITYGEAAVAQMKTVDWTTVSERRADWLNKFNREMR